MSAQARRAQAEQDFKSMLTELQQCLPSKLQETLANLPFPSIDDAAPIDIQASQMEAAIIPLIKMMDDSPDAKSKSRKVKSVVIGWFRASYPFASLFLNVAKSGASVISKQRFPAYTWQITSLNPYGLVCAGLIALLDVLDPDMCIVFT